MSRPSRLQDHTALAALWPSEVTDRELCAWFGCARSVLYRTAARLGLPGRRWARRQVRIDAAARAVQEHNARYTLGSEIPIILRNGRASVAVMIGIAYVQQDGQAVVPVEIRGMACRISIPTRSGTAR